MRISAKSYQQMSANARALYVDDLSVVMRSKYPEVFFLKSDEECHSLVERRVNEALGLGLSQREIVTRFVEVQMDLRGELTNDLAWRWLLDCFLDMSRSEGDRASEISHLLDSAVHRGKP